MLFGKALNDYLAYAVYGKTRREKPERKPPTLARKSIPKKKRAGKPRRSPERNEAYKAWIRTLPCTRCRIEGKSEAAHTGEDGGMRMKASDYSCIPLCAWCHTGAPDSYHSPSGKQALETRIGRACADVARELRAEWDEKYFSFCY